MPITGCFMGLLFVFKHHKHLMTSLFLQLETLSGSFFILEDVEKKVGKTSGSFWVVFLLLYRFFLSSDLKKVATHGKFFFVAGSDLFLFYLILLLAKKQKKAFIELITAANEQT